MTWIANLNRASEELKSIPLEGKDVVLVDDAQFSETWIPQAGRIIPFLEKNGHYWGPPSDSQTAIDAIERLRSGGARYLIFAWPAFWWLEYYPEFSEHLRANYHSVLQNDRLLVMKLSSSKFAVLPEVPSSS